MFVLAFFSTQALGAPTVVNRPPTASAQNVVTNEDTSLAIALSGSDPEGAALTYAIVASPGKGSLSCLGNLCNYVPVTNINGYDFFTFNVSDGSLTSRNARVGITITVINDSPTVESTVLKLSGTGSTTLVGSDVEGSDLTFRIVEEPTSGEAKIIGNRLVYQTDDLFSGEDFISFVASDGQDESAPGSVDVTAVGSDVVVSLDANYLESIPEVTTSVLDDKTVVTMASHDCYALMSSPLIVPLQNGDEVVVGTLHSLCQGDVDVENYTFFINTSNGQAYRPISEREQDLQPDAQGLLRYVAPLGMLVEPLMATNIAAEDEDAPTGGLMVYQDGVARYINPFKGRLVPEVLVVDGMILASTENNDQPTCQNGAKIDAENCGVWGMIDPNMGEMIDSSIGNTLYETSYTAAQTQLVVTDSDGDNQKSLLVWGTGLGGNNWDTTSDVGGACSVFAMNKKGFMEAAYNQDLINFDFFADDFSLGGKTFDPGDAGCVASSTTDKDAFLGEMTIGFNPETGHPTFWGKMTEPDVDGSAATKIIQFDESLDVVCEAEISAGSERNPFNTNAGVVVASDGTVYVSATYRDASGVERTSLLAIDLTDCAVTPLLELNAAAIGGSFGDVTLAMNGNEETLLLASVAGSLYVYNATTGEYTTHTLGSPSSDPVIAAPVLDSLGHVIVMSTNNVMTIFGDLGEIALGDLSYGSHFWPRPGKDNFGSATITMVGN